MLKYVAIIAGLLIMCVPDDAGILRAIIQSGVGLLLFAYGIGALIESAR